MPLMHTRGREGERVISFLLKYALSETTGRKTWARLKKTILFNNTSGLCFDLLYDEKRWEYIHPHDRSFPFIHLISKIWVVGNRIYSRERVAA